MLELLSPAGSPEAVIAAVQNGADAVYLGLSDFNARRGAQNFSREEFLKAVRYCRIRGCRVYVTLNTLVNDREFAQAVDAARTVSEAGADAVLVQDLGLAAAIRHALPDLPVHASTQMSIHNLAGVEAAAQMGITRAVLARELSLEQIRFIAQHATIETLSAGAAATEACALSRADCSILWAAGWMIIRSRSRTAALWTG